MNAGKFLAVFLLIAAFGILQNTDFLSIGGLKPNAVLAALVALAFFTDIWPQVFFSLFSAWILNSPAILIATAAVWAADRWPTNPALTNQILIGAATIGFYVLASPGHIFSEPFRLAAELVYNLLLGAVLFKVFHEWLKTSLMLKT